MELVDFKEAIEQIVQGVTDADKSRFFFVVGAGISTPVVPIARDMEAHFRSVVRNARDEQRELDRSPMDSYTYWFKCAYQQPWQRHRYIRDLVENKPVSPANFRLAHLLLHRRITNTIVTPNFDDFLERALRLFGENPIVCDHPDTTERIDPELDRLQIIHVHGTYQFYDCCNLKGEIARAARKVQERPTMASLLDSLLSHRSPIVVGYSGWESDIIMTALQRRLRPSSSLYCNLYWFCHTQDDLARLPKWLKSHPHVCLVAPVQPKRKAATVGRSQEVSVADLQEMMESRDAVSDATIAKLSASDSVSSQTVFEEMIRQLELPLPLLTTDPVGFLAEQIKGNLLKEDSPGGEGDIYLLSSIVNRLENAKKSDAEYMSEQKIEQVVDALRRSEYREAVARGLELKDAQLDALQLEKLANMMGSAASELGDNSTDELEGYDLAIVLAERAIQRDPYHQADLKLIKSRALLFKAATLLALGDFDGTLRSCDELTAQFGGSADEVLLLNVSRGLMIRGYCLETQEKFDEAIPIFRKVVADFGERRAFDQDVGRAIVSVLVDLSKLERNEEIVAECDEMLERFSESNDPDMLIALAMTCNARAFAFNNMGKREEALAAFQQTIDRFAACSVKRAQEEIGWAMCMKAVYSESTDPSASLALYEEVVRRLKPARGEEARAPVKMARARLRVLKAQRKGRNAAGEP